MAPLRNVTERIARGTTRRGLFGRSADLVFGALAGAAAGTALGVGGTAIAGGADTVCAFPGPPCNCERCQPNGVCAKPCVILTTFYASGCWTTASITCCDCDCELAGETVCGCGSDYHNNPAHCP